MTKEYERTLTESEKKILKKRIEKAKSEIPKDVSLLILQILIVIGFGILVFYFPKIWLIIILSIIVFFLIWNLYMDLPGFIRLPKTLKDMEKIIGNGVVRVNEINIDRYIKINNIEDEGNHFIVEYDGILNLIGGQEFLGVRKLKNKIEYIEILNSNKTGIYYDKVKKYGDNINPYYTFNKGISDEFVESKIWENLTNGNPFSGKLEELDKFIELDKRK